MAYIKQKTLANGTSGNYWSIYRTNNVKNGNTEVVIALYVSKTFYEQLKAENRADQGILAVKNFSLQIPKDIYLEGDVYERAYLEMKTSTSDSEAQDEEGNPIPYFEDAEVDD